MKISTKQIRCALFAVFTCCNAAAVQAQEVGIRFAAAVSHDALRQKSPADYIGNDRSTWNLSPGVYYNQPLYKRLGLSTGLNYLRFARVLEEGHFYIWGPTRFNYDILEVPALLTVDLCPTAHRWGVRAIAGYSIGAIVAAQGIGNDRFIEETEEYKVDASRLSAYHFFNAGFEAHHRWRSGLTASVGLQARWGARTENSYEVYRVSDFCVVLKTGFIKPAIKPVAY